MARSYRPVVRDQEFLLPPNMADWLPADHLVWFVIDVIDRLDTKAFHIRSRRGGVGRQGFDPDMLLGLLVYAYAVGERSSRRIERLCLDHVAFRVLCGQDAPDHTTLARFRAAHQGDFAALFTQVLRLAAEAGMVRVGVVSIDGTKVAADASRGANRTSKWLREQAQRLAEQIVAEAAAADESEDAEAATGRGSSHDDRLPPTMAERGQRAARIEKALEELGRVEAEEQAADAADARTHEEFLVRAEAGQARLGRPPAGLDPVTFQQARLRYWQRRLDELEGLTGPTASRQRSEAKRRLRKHAETLTQAQAAAAAGTVDRRGKAARARDRRTDRARARGGRGPSVNLTDPDSRLMSTANGGSIQGYNAQAAVTNDHLILGVHLSQDANDTSCFIPTLTAAQDVLDALNLQMALEKDLEFGTVLADAGYFTQENLTSPGPDRLIAPGKNRELFHDVRQHPASGPPPEDATAEEAMRHRLRTVEDAELYKRRSATVETVFAHLQELTKLTRFSRRGLTANLSELHLAAAAHNIRRIYNAAPQPC